MNTLSIIFILFYCTYFVFLFQCLYILNRNNKVAAFRGKLIDMSSEYNKRRINEHDFDYKCAYEWFLNKYTYKRMLYSFKPLKLEAWFTEEEIKEINR